MQFHTPSLTLSLFILLASSPGSPTSPGSLFAESEILKIESYPKVVFEDDFSGELNKRWKFASAKSKIMGGALFTTHKPGHGAVHGVRFMETPFKDMAVSCRFKPTEGKIHLHVAFNDFQYKQVHGGHVCRVIIKNKFVLFSDDKNGNANNTIWEKRKAKKPLTDAEQKALKDSRKKVPVKLSNDWHDLEVMVSGDLMQVNIDGKVIGSFRNGGNAHPTKKHVALISGEALMLIDDVKMRMRP